MCFSVVTLQPCSLRSSGKNIRIQQQQQQRQQSIRRRRSITSSRSGRLVWSLSGLAASAMAPALTQATPHQRCCPPNSSSTSPSLTLLPSSKHHSTLSSSTTSSSSSLLKKESHCVEEQQLVWPSSPPRCCGSNGQSAAVKTDSRRVECNNSNNISSSAASSNSSNKSRKSFGVVNGGKEIARSEELTKSRGGVGRGAGGGGGGGVAESHGQGALDPPPAVVKALAVTGPPPTTGQGPDVDLAHTITSAGAVAPRSSPPSNGGRGSPSLNGNAESTMGLHPTAPGDRMDLESPPMVVQTPGKTPEWTTSTKTTTATTTTSISNQVVEVAEVAEEEVDDILDVIKSMEVDQCGVDIGLTVAEQQLLHEAAAAVMDEAALPVVVNNAPAPTVDKEAEVERRLAEACTKQQQIEARCQTLLRRAGRLQSRHVGRHVADQVAHFVAYAKETLSIGAKGRGGHHGLGGSSLYGWAEDGRLPTREEVRNIPTATLVNLVSRLQAPPVSYLSNRRYFGLTSRSMNNSQQQQHPQTTTNNNTNSSNNSSNNSNNNHLGQQLSSQVAETLEEVAGLWEAQLRYLQRHDDPDATESSSGGESDDENSPVATEPSVPTETASLESSTNVGSTPSTPAGAPTSNPTTKPVSTYQRAAWRWARDRAAVAARWSWLQAQVSDLEYRIRQHTDVYRQLRAAKGPIQFAPANGLTSPTTVTPSVTTASPSKETSCDDETLSEAACSSSSRTRPLVHASGGSGFRHRRLIKASQITAGSGRKSSRHSSTVRCCCVMSRIYHPCVLCNGKNNYLLPVDPDGMTLRERIGLTDRGFHPVLSLPQDIPLSAHVDSLLKSGDWRPPPPPTPTSRATVNNRRSSSKPTHDAEETSSVKRKTNNKRKKAIDGGSEDGNVKLDRRKTLLKRRKRSTLSTDALDEDSGSSAFPSSPYDTGSVPSTPGRPGNRNERSSVFQDLMRRRTSYDIDNIVIPYSMAATTRVERLQYKEIQTPKWRTVDEEELAAGQESEREDIEDVSEEACIARHDRSELDERRKFMSYLKQPAGLTRGRRRVDQIDRLDSRADQSSGANTPDPMSPSQAGSKAADGAMMDVDLPPTEEGERVPDAPADGSFTASAIKERRRTASLTKRDSSVWKFVNDENSGMSWEMDEFHAVAPYEPRQFPLLDSVYDQLVDEMPPEEAEEELASHEKRSTKRETRSSECGGGVVGGPSSSGAPVTAVAGATPTTTTTSSVDDEAVTFISESTSSPGADDLDIDDEDPNDPEWEGSQGSAPRSKQKR